MVRTTGIGGLPTCCLILIPAAASGFFATLTLTRTPGDSRQTGFKQDL